MMPTGHFIEITAAGYLENELSPTLQVYDFWVVGRSAGSASRAHWAVSMRCVAPGRRLGVDHALRRSGCAGRCPRVASLRAGSRVVRMHCIAPGNPGRLRLSSVGIAG